VELDVGVRLDVTDLASALANRAWLHRSQPFPHVVAHDVFTTDFYQSLEAQLRAVLDAGLSEVPDRTRFSRNIPGYDSYGIGFGALMPHPIGLFLSPAWRDLVCGLFGVERTPYVFAGAHHHAVGSSSGFVHNDYNPVWFVRSHDGRIRTPDPARCAYKTGEGTLPDSAKIEMVRGVAVLFFLLNDGWRPGDGGETGLYHLGRDPVDAPAVRCPPVNNSLVAFECTPHSFHTYLANPRLPRTSIIMWVHRGMADADAAHGVDAVERWTS
jgi:hypothetical protein